MPESCRCPPAERELGRVLFRGGGYHVVERCRLCRRNVRGPGRWVPQSELRSDPRTLPVFHDGRSPEEKGEQRLLF